MSRYIDADALIGLMESYYDTKVIAPIEYLAELRKSIDQVKVFADRKSVDVAPIVHGFWVRIFENRYTCSCCGNEMQQFDWLVKFCPFCGAKMDGEENEGIRSKRLKEYWARCQYCTPYLCEDCNAKKYCTRFDMYGKEKIDERKAD